MTSRKEIVQSYYTNVDINNFSFFRKIFAPSIVYERAEHMIVGLESLVKFYKNERKIVGNHYVDSIFEDQTTVIVVGKFKGLNSESNNIVIDFADFFYFNERSILINRRKTYLASGYELTK